MINNYYETLGKFRLKAANDFFKVNEKYEEIIELMNKFLKNSFNQLEGPSPPTVENSQYIFLLIPSFIRSHHIIIEHILHSELIEAMVLLRKQFELLSRLNELKEKDIDDLIRKTPNMKHVKTQINKLYSVYSEVAHSASSEFISLMGVKSDDDKKLIKLFPEFNEHTEVTFQHAVLCFSEFMMWMIDFKKEHLSDYEPTDDIKLADNLFKLCVKSELFEVDQ